MCSSWGRACWVRAGGQAGQSLAVILDVEEVLGVLDLHHIPPVQTGGGSCTLCKPCTQAPDQQTHIPSNLPFSPLQNISNSLGVGSAGVAAPPVSTAAPAPVQVPGSWSPDFSQMAGSPDAAPVPSSNGHGGAPGEPWSYGLVLM